MGKTWVKGSHFSRFGAGVIGPLPSEEIIDTAGINRYVCLPMVVGSRGFTPTIEQSGRFSNGRTSSQEGTGRTEKICP